jgi:hypothetical protein
MRIHSMRTEKESGCDILAGHSFSKELSNLSFPRRQQVVYVLMTLLLRLPDVIFDKKFADSRAKKTPCRRSPRERPGSRPLLPRLSVDILWRQISERGAGNFRRHAC